MRTQRIGTVTAGVLNVRPTPSTEQAPMAQLEHGQIVSIKATEGVSYPAGLPWFSAPWPALRQAGGDRYGKTWFRGCYHYLIMRDGGAQQAELYLSSVDDAGGCGDGDMPPIVDVERGQEGSNNFGASKQQVIDVTSAWSETIRSEPGRKTMRYGRNAMRDLDITDRMGSDYLWAPRYNHVLGSTSDIGWPTGLVKLWQYTDGKANVTPYPDTAPDIGSTDMSTFLGTLDEPGRARCRLARDELRPCT